VTDTTALAWVSLNRRRRRSSPARARARAQARILPGSTMLALTTTAMLLAGCGSSTHPSSISAPVGADKPIANAQALAYAHAVNLRAGDVPATTSKRTAESVKIVRAQRKPSVFQRCVEVPAARLVLVIHSAIFGAPYWWMRSTVEVMPSDAFATAYAAVFGSSRDWPCFFPRQADLKVAFSALQVASPFVGIRVTQSAGTIAQTYQDIFAFASGRAMVTLSISGSKMPAFTAEQRLLTLLYNRAEAHKLR
jgi:hypothetical protein